MLAHIKREQSWEWSSIVGRKLGAAGRLMGRRGRRGAHRPISLCAQAATAPSRSVQAATFARVTLIEGKPQDLRALALAVLLLAACRAAEVAPI